MSYPTTVTPTPEGRRWVVVWPLTVVVLLAAAGLTVLSLEEGWGEAGQLVSGGIVLAALVLLTLAARAITTRSGSGEGFVSALVTVFVLLPLAGFLYVASSALGAVEDIGDAFEDSGLDTGGDTGSGSTDAFDECFAQPETTYEECAPLLEE